MNSIKYLSGLIDSMKIHDWMKEDILEFIGKPTFTPAFFSTSSLYRIARLWDLWLKVHAGGGLPNEQKLIENIEVSTRGTKARCREEREWRLDGINVLSITGGWKCDHGPAMGFSMVRLQTGSCNLRCPYCPQPMTWDQGKMQTIWNIEKTIKDVGRDDMIMMVSGGEPLLWSNNPAFVDLLYRWNLLKRQVHLRTNGTLRPNRITRDVFGLIQVEPDLIASPDIEHWKQTIKWWENNNPPIWAPVIYPETAEAVKSLFIEVDPDRIYPQARRAQDTGLLEATANEMMWRLNTVSP